MNPCNIAVFVGSLRAASINLRLARALEKLMPANFRFDYVSLGDVPLYNQDNENDLPAPVARFKQQVRDAQAVLFVSPEHNRSVPAALKNVIDWGTRPWGQNVWTDKAVGILGTAPGAAATALMQQHLRNILAAEGALALTTPEVFLQYTDGLIDDQYHITNEGTRKFLQGWIDRYVDWIKKLNA